MHSLFDAVATHILPHLYHFSVSLVVCCLTYRNHWATSKSCVNMGKGESPATTVNYLPVISCQKDRTATFTIATQVEEGAAPLTRAYKPETNESLEWHTGSGTGQWTAKGSDSVRLVCEFHGYIIIVLILRVSHILCATVMNVGKKVKKDFQLERNRKKLKPLGRLNLKPRMRRLQLKLVGTWLCSLLYPLYSYMTVTCRKIIRVFRWTPVFVYVLAASVYNGPGKKIPKITNVFKDDCQTMRINAHSGGKWPHRSTGPKIRRECHGRVVYWALARARTWILSERRNRVPAISLF
jgi:hypothetical protein